jgi:dephospho-CoA kinase
MKVIGIVGMNGSGKGTVVELLQKKYPIGHISARALITDLASGVGVDISNRDDMREFNEKRNREGKTLVQEIERLYDKAENTDKTFAFESVRRISEIKELRTTFEEDFILLGINADVEKRFERAVLRNSISDQVSFERFLEQERLESISEDENQMNLPKCMAEAGFVIDNSGTMEDLELQVGEFAAKYPNFFQV